MPKSEEEKTETNVWAAIGAGVILLLIMALLILVPGLYVKLWEWVY